MYSKQPRLLKSRYRMLASKNRAGLETSRFSEKILRLSNEAYPIFLAEAPYKYTAQFRRIRKDKGRKRRGFGSPGFTRRTPRVRSGMGFNRFQRRKRGVGGVVGNALASTASNVSTEVLAAAGTTIVLNKLASGKDKVGTVALEVPPPVVQLAPKPGIRSAISQRLSAIGQRLAPQTEVLPIIEPPMGFRQQIRGRLNRAGARVQRGINSYQDISRLPAKRSDKFKAAIGLTGLTGVDVIRDLVRPLATKRRK